MPSTAPKSLRIAIAQTPGAPLDAWLTTLDTIDQLLSTAAENGADLLVLPECAWPAYVIGSTAAYHAARRQGLPDEHYFLDHLAARARDAHLMICAGYVAEQDQRLWNRAALIDADGAILGAYDKCFLWDFDHDWFAPGRSIQPIDTRLGRIGIMICADARLPEIAATLTARGAQLILQPTAWVNGGTPQRFWNPQPDFLIPARAAEHGIPIASASKCGVEGTTTFVGSSLICAAGGERLAICDQHATSLSLAEVRLGRPRRFELSPPQRERLLSAGLSPPPNPPAAKLTVRRSDSRIIVELRGASPAAGRPGSPPALRIDGPREELLEFSPPAARPMPDPPRSARIAVIADTAARNFAAARIAALAGAHLVVVWGTRALPESLRARAAENRVFVVAAGENGSLAFDVRGLPLKPAASTADTETYLLNLPQACSKHVAPRTDVLAGRTPALYEF